MNLIELKEPRLEFAEGKHLCPRHGIAEYSVYDSGLETRPEKIVVGVVGTEDGIERFAAFIRWTAGGVESDSPNQRLYPAFCGMSKNQGFHSVFSTGSDVQQIIPGTEIRTVKSIQSYTDRVSSAVNLYLERIDFLCSFKRPDVVLCVLPEDLYTSIRHNVETKGDDEKLEQQYETTTRHIDFRALLKAKALRYNVPLQVIRADNLLKEAKNVQNAATRAWNLCTALYFKSNMTAPWKLFSPDPSYPTCFLGISFFKSLDGSTLDSSTAQIFDELGKSVILRGRPAAITKEDRAPYLKERDAYDLLRDGLQAYRTAVRNTPSRLVVHKTSRFLPEEVSGFEQAASEDSIEMLDLVSVSNSRIRLYREHLYPPIRGSMLQLGEETAVLYTRGSVPFFRTYPGPYVPEPLEISVFRSDRSLKTICSEVLGLTKMNWNNTQFDNKNPITLGCARRVGEVIKYLDDGENPQPSYAFYM